ncbi:TPA: aspartate--ammonia ligase [Clostridium botulinum]|uniref:Aspartate--ammonia ligase n=1 Tax=Clostridium botulinum TaxID=1491 RepID=A0ABC8CSA3_CLOBO|nr:MULTISPECIES: aspartate--ammonia ligase [Clostridium]AUM95403.1 aspartate--ammonia ligase [Clostridium sporogenes]AVQ38595.1 aspartate--ammonia ligase [Clostridium botulinum]AVQ52845.1 aspartate--ammonia ligase [Clostridium botulinum]MBO0524088.1 aspartate--ammonia ligase [Clostridium botulinum]MBO0528858.1 aspartate--ammonia ligase [Clostridium botulinum]
MIKFKDRLMIPEGYESTLGIRETEVAIKKVKDFFERTLAEKLNLTRVSAPLFVRKNTGMNDNLNGVERPVAFDMKDLQDEMIEIVHSLAKWKRMALHRYDFKVGEGLYTDMNAIRRDEDLDNLHSIYVDQWDWEKVIKKEDRNKETLKSIVNKIYSVFKETERYICSQYEGLNEILPEKICFITSQELEDTYPDLDSKEREDAITKEKGAVFLMEIGGVLASGEKHDGRAPDYDDWTLNGDILFWNPVLERAFELSSMGIRVDEESLERQLKIAGCEDRKNLEFHRLLLEGKLPYTVGGGIGQSRICMYFLRKAHIGEVQASIWPDLMIEDCEKAKISLL